MCRFILRPGEPHGILVPRYQMTVTGWCPVSVGCTKLDIDQIQDPVANSALCHDLLRKLAYLLDGTFEALRSRYTDRDPNERAWWTP